ncbi:hypothetical protein LB504_006891 [Fusarium proliferatum]|nr:hypothetical protein LB504_006891 [Fusarium proliferatum]
MTDKIITFKSVFDWTIEYTPSHFMPLANPKHAQDQISISLLTIPKLKRSHNLMLISGLDQLGGLLDG